MNRRDKRTLDAVARAHADWLLQTMVYAGLLADNGDPAGAARLIALGGDLTEIVGREIGRARLVKAIDRNGAKAFGADWQTRPLDAMPPGRLH